MNFTDLYRHANSLTGSFVPVEQLRAEVNRSHPTVNEVVFWACSLERKISLGHMVLELGRSSPYDDPFITASIRFDASLPNDWARFVCAKELMHVFDSSFEQANSKDRFLQLMDELENNPISVDQSEMFKSERNAEWMAVITLCPLRLRTAAVAAFAAGKSEAEIASDLMIPAPYMNAVLGSRYLPALEHLTGEAGVTLKLVEGGAG